MHDAWFRGEVEQALREADDPNAEWISDGDAKASWAVQRAELRARIGSAGDGIATAPNSSLRGAQRRSNPYVDGPTRHPWITSPPRFTRGSQ